jgi:Golgi nucleoside diphosphatase
MLLVREVVLGKNKNGVKNLKGTSLTFLLLKKGLKLHFRETLKNKACF